MRRRDPVPWPSRALCTAAPLIADPMLGALGDHGGSKETLVPAAGSPARGIAHDCPPIDQRGKPRAEPCTAGAAEPDQARSRLAAASG